MKFLQKMYKMQVQSKIYKARWKWLSIYNLSNFKMMIKNFEKSKMLYARRNFSPYFAMYSFTYSFVFIFTDSVKAISSIGLFWCWNSFNIT